MHEKLHLSRVLLTMHEALHFEKATLGLPSPTSFSLFMYITTMFFRNAKPNSPRPAIAQHSLLSYRSALTCSCPKTESRSPLSHTMQHSSAPIAVLQCTIASDTTYLTRIRVEDGGIASRTSTLSSCLLTRLQTWSVWSVWSIYLGIEV